MAVPDSTAYLCYACKQEFTPERSVSLNEAMVRFRQVNYRELKHGGEVYEFTERLGKGSTGEVLRARRVSDQMEVAIKRLYQVGQPSHFMREATILRDAPHPNLVKYVDIVEGQKNAEELEFYLILEYLEGMPDASLRERIKNSADGLDPAEALQLFACYLDSLAHLHQNGIIHRNIKPCNLYAPPGNPCKAKILDVNIPKIEEGTGTNGFVPGSLDFMPPEFATQDRGGGSAQSDIYSIGVTLYATLTKKLPFPRLSGRESEPFVDVFTRAINPLKCAFTHPVFAEHAELIPLLRRALEHDPLRRYPNAGLMRDEIKIILGKLKKTIVSPDVEFKEKRLTAGTQSKQSVAEISLQQKSVAKDASATTALAPVSDAKYPMAEDCTRMLNPSELPNWVSRESEVANKRSLKQRLTTTVILLLLVLAVLLTVS